MHRGGLIAGWVVGMGLALWMLWKIPNPAIHKAHFGGSAFPLTSFGFSSPKTIYVGFVAVLVNLVVAVLVTLALRALKTPDGVDGTTPSDYFADEGDPRIDRSATAVETVSST
jgi:SSS family solute:Na+ symporter